MLAAMVMFAQPFDPGLGGSSSTTGPVSPSVMATSMCVMNGEGQGTLELLVLWRGSPAWFWRDRDKGSSGGSSGGGGMRGSGAAEVRTQWISQGAVNLNLRFEPASRRLWILDQEIPLHDANVVLVDGVDEPGGPRVVGTVRIDPAFDSATDLPPGMPTGPPGPRPRAQGVPTQTFIRRSPELVEFLQCGVPAPGVRPAEQQALDMWCAWSTQP